MCAVITSTLLRCFSMLSSLTVNEATVRRLVLASVWVPKDDLVGLRILGLEQGGLSARRASSCCRRQ
jgi:hypothetical protein